MVWFLILHSALQSARAYRARLLQDIRILIYFKIANHCCSLRGPDVKVDYNCTWIFPRVVVKNVFPFVVISWFCFFIIIIIIIIIIIVIIISPNRKVEKVSCYSKDSNPF